MLVIWSKVNTWLVIKKQTNSEIKAVMPPFQEGYSSSSFLNYFLPLPSVSASQYSWSCLGGSGAQRSPFMFAAVFGFESCVPLPVTCVWPARTDLCAGRVVWLWQFCPPGTLLTLFALCSQTAGGGRQGSACPEKGWADLCYRCALLTSVRGTWGCFHVCDTEQDFFITIQPV